MANGDDTLPQLKDPKAFRAQFQDTAAPATKARPAAASPVKVARGDAASVFGGLMNALDSVEDPFTRSLVQGAMEARISDRLGFRFKFPVPEEEDLLRQQTQNDLDAERVKGAELTVQLAQAAMLDYFDSNPSVRQAVGIEEGEDVFQTDPERAIALSAEMFDAGLLPRPVTRGMLRMAKLPTNALEAKSMAEQRLADEREELGKSAAAGEAAKKRAELMSEVDDEESLLGGAIQAAMKRTEAAAEEGVDLESDLDTDRGSELFYDFTERATRDVAKATGQDESLIARAMLGGEIGKNIADQLGGLGKNALGEIVVGKGDLGVSDAATVNLVASVMNLAGKAKIPLRDAFGLIGSEYSGVDRDSLEAGIVQMAKQRGVKPEVQMQAMGRGFLETVMRMDEEKKVQRRALTK